jgi:adenine-specific DNA-methyltransferase
MNVSTGAGAPALDTLSVPGREDLLERVDFKRLDACRRLDPKRRAEMGQFLTPPKVARLMASMFDCRQSSLRLLDAGAGVGSLSAAWVEAACARQSPPREIEVTAYEVDPLLAEHLEETLEACTAYCHRHDVRFKGAVRRQDFIEDGVAFLRGGIFDPPLEQYDCAILNPPYRKINTDSKTRRLLEAVNAETTNLYAAFISLVTGLLQPGGELVAITPRSFCNGPYFKSFRTAFLSSMALRRVHSFDRRDRAFHEDEVLQENVIFHAVKGGQESRVVVSSSAGPDDECLMSREVELPLLVKPNDPDRFLHIPSDALSDAITLRMQQFTAALRKLGLQVSTGRVVDFRAKAHLRPQPGDGTVPLIYPTHFTDGFVSWPRNGGKKPNALALTPETRDLVVPPGFYVLVKRFTSKEEPRRVVAAIYDPRRMPPSSVGFENHLNYFHAAGRPLEERLAKGLAAFLNSTLVDSYFREWSGHTQVNATDLRSFGYPSRDQLEALGAAIGDVLPTQEELDDRIEQELLKVPRVRTIPDPIRAKRRLKEAREVLKLLGLPRQQQNDRSALTLLAFLDLKPKTPWSKAQSPLRGITQMMEFFAEHYGREYAPNSRETVRRQTVHQFVDAGLILLNPDEPSRPINSGKFVYQIEPSALELLRKFKSPAWTPDLRTYLTSVETLEHRYAQKREMDRIPLKLASGKPITLSPGGQNVLVEKIIHEFCPRFTPEAAPIYVGDTDEKWAHFDKERLEALGVTLDPHGKMPDVVVHQEDKDWLVLIEAVTSHGPVDRVLSAGVLDLLT